MGKNILPLQQEDYDKMFMRYAHRHIIQDQQTDRKKYELDLMEPIANVLEIFNNKLNHRFLVLSGEHGSGKTTLFRILHRIHRDMRENEFKIIESRQLVQKTEEEGRSMIKKFTYGKLMINDYSFKDKEANHYRDRIAAIDELVYMRWEVGGIGTMFTTNIVEKEDFLQSFSERVQQRMKHNLNWIYLTGKNFRKND